MVANAHAQHSLSLLGRILPGSRRTHQKKEFVMQSRAGEPTSQRGSKTAEACGAVGTCESIRRSLQYRCLLKYWNPLPVKDTMDFIPGVGHSVLHLWHPIRHDREDSKAEAVIRGQDYGGQEYQLSPE
jgi:hypothetical protein